MRRPALSASFLLTLVPCLSGPSACGQDPTPEEANRTLTAVTKTISHAFAATPDGLFRAPLSTKHWERLKTPPEMPPDGKFAGLPEESSLVVYVAARTRAADPPGSAFRYGLYLSKDGGATWELATERADFGAVLLLESGSLLAVVGGGEAHRGDRILRSTDLGKSWSDITGEAVGRFYSLQAGPDDPARVRVFADWGIRGGMYEAEDGKFDWLAIRGPMGMGAAGGFFARNSATYNRSHVYPATLANYFGHDFGDKIQVDALEVLPEKPRFEFERGDPLVVPIRVVLRFDPDARWPAFGRTEEAPPEMPIPREKFADRRGATDFWRLRVEAPVLRSRENPRGRLTLSGSGVVGAGGAVVPPPRHPDYQVFDLGPSAPYERDLDLARFGDFSKPGEYRVQAIYNSGSGQFDDKSIWAGMFTSPVFTVVIRE